jgi:hypothetical protein
MSVSARWAAGIASVEIRHDRPDRKRVYLRLDLDEAKRLRDELGVVIGEREPDHKERQCPCGACGPCANPQCHIRTGIAPGGSQVDGDTPRPTNLYQVALRAVVNAYGTKPRHTIARDGSHRDDCIPCGLVALAECFPDHGIAARVAKNLRL